MWVNSACPRAAVRAKPAPPPWAEKAWPLNVAWERMGHQEITPLEGQQALNEIQYKLHNQKGTISQLGQQQLPELWRSPSTLVLEGSTTHELEGLEAPLLDRKRALTTWCTADQLEEQECSGGSHF